jgi:AcrR family transcriptional regulator
MIRLVATVKKRTYTTTIRRGDAPRLVSAAARRLFVTKGYLATSMDDIAAEAGVARPTVFSAVGTKPTILKAVVDQAMSGDDLPVAVADRPWFAEAVAEPDPRRAVRLHVRNICRIQERVAGLLRALESAAALDADVEDLHALVRRQRREGLAGIAADIASKADLLVDEATLADVLFVLPPDAYYRLVLQEGWTPERFETWLGDLVERMTLPPAAG